MWFICYTCAVATILLMLGHVQGSSDLKHFSLNLRHRLIGEVLVSIAKEQHFTKDICLSDITFDADTQTTVVFTHLCLMGTDVEVPRIVGDYEIDSNDVQQTMPRSGHLNVTFTELLKEAGWEPLVDSQQLPPTGTHIAKVDDLVDFILLVVGDTLRETGRDHIQIPNVNESFYFLGQGRVIADGGYLRNLATVHRTTDTVVTTVGTNLSVVCGIGLQTLQLGYKHYEANLGSIKASGKITVTIPHNSITIKISLTYVNETCRATLDSLKVTQFSGIQVDITGLDGFDWLLSFIARCASGSYRDKIVNAVEEQLSADIEKLLGHFQCDQYFQQIHKQLEAFY